LREPSIPEPNIHETALILPGAHVHGDVTLAEEVIVLFGVVIRAELDRIVVGQRSNVQDNAVLHCDEDIPTIVGERVTIGHNAVVHGATVGDGALIGIGATALNRSTVGEGAWLAAGSVLPEGKGVPPWTLAVGTPARPIRELSEEEVARAEEGVDNYLMLASRYREIFGSNTRP
jgi:carbonic anhydrase/acetyltransferase-like protein (isoleucine patch superfamily)